MAVKIRLKRDEICYNGCKRWIYERLLKGKFQLFQDIQGDQKS